METREKENKKINNIQTAMSVVVFRYLFFAYPIQFVNYFVAWHTKLRNAKTSKRTKMAKGPLCRQYITINRTATQLKQQWATVDARAFMRSYMVLFFVYDYDACVYTFGIMYIFF